MSSQLTANLLLPTRALASPRFDFSNKDKRVAVKREELASSSHQSITPSTKLHAQG